MSNFTIGDIVLVDLNPTKGHEQQNKRPVLVMNGVPLPGGMNIVLPITSKVKSYPLDVTLDRRTKTQGTIMCYQIRAVDLASRQAVFLEKAPSDIVQCCSDYINRLTR